jgi:hypothetical protein
MPTAITPAPPPSALSACTMSSLSPCADSEAPAPEGLAITPFGASSLAGKTRATEATSSGYLDALPVLNLKTFVLSPPPRVCVVQGSVGAKRDREDLDKAEGSGLGLVLLARGAEERKKSTAKGESGSGHWTKLDNGQRVWVSADDPPAKAPAKASTASGGSGSGHWTKGDNGERVWVPASPSTEGAGGEAAVAGPPAAKRSKLSLSKKSKADDGDGGAPLTDEDPAAKVLARAQIGWFPAVVLAGWRDFARSVSCRPPR